MNSSNLNTRPISLKSVNYGWQKDEPFLTIDSLSVLPGEKLFLYGPSGSGKSTLLNLIAGIILPQSGSVNLLGTAMNTLSHRKRDQFRAQHMGIIFQQFNLIPYLNVIDNLRMRVEFLPQNQKQKALVQIPEVLERLQIAQVVQQKAYQLSVGQQQRVALARALLGYPKIIIADEPTSALDSELRGEFMHLLFDVLDEKTCLLFVSHDQQLLSRFDRVINIQLFRTQATASTQREVS